MKFVVTAALCSLLVPSASFASDGMTVKKSVKGVTVQSTNTNVVLKNIITSGQPTKADLVQMKALGVKKVISLRAPSESPDKNKTAIWSKELGLPYVNLVIQGKDDLTKENAKKPWNKVGAGKKGPVYVHCGSGNRVGALLAMGANHFGGYNAPKSLEIGRKAGMTSLEKTVKSRLK